MADNFSLPADAQARLKMFVESQQGNRSGESSIGRQTKQPATNPADRSEKARKD